MEGGYRSVRSSRETLARRTALAEMKKHLGRFQNIMGGGGRQEIEIEPIDTLWIHASGRHCLHPTQIIIWNSFF